MAVYFGTNGNDNLVGTSDGDTFLTNRGSDTVSGGAGNDTILVTGGQGSGTGFADVIDGGTGSDVVILGGSPADYDVTFTNDGNVVVTGKPGTPGAGFAETLISVETIAFDTGAMRIVDPAGGEGSFATIQSAIDAGEPGDVVVVKSGTYAEAVVVDKAITLIGNPAGTTIDSPGTGYGINLKGDIDAGAGGAGTVTIEGFTLTGNSTAVKAADGLVLDSLVLTNVNVFDNKTSGVTVEDDRVANVTISGSTFGNNGAGNGNAGSIVLYEFTGNATIENTTITSTLAAANSSGYAIQIAGRDQATYDTTEPMGNVVLSNVDILGDYKKPALLIQGYTDLSGFDASDVTITGKTSYPTGDFSAVVFIDPIGSSGAAPEGTSGYPGYLEQDGGTSTLDLSGITVTNTSMTAIVDVVVRGLDDDDAITGTNGNDYLNFPAEEGIDYGGNDTIDGAGGDDVIVGGYGDDVADGGEDNDTFVLYGDRDDYTITEIGNGTYTVTDNNLEDGDEGTDQLSGIEKILFNGDGSTIELDANSPTYDGALERFSESFEDGDAEDTFQDEDTNWSGQMTVVASGANGIDAADGGEYAVFEQTGEPGDETGPFSRLGGYRAYFGEGYEVETKIYLDTSWAAGSGFDVSVASNNQSGGHLRDFIFHVTQDTSTGELLIGANNGTTFDPSENLENGNHAAVDVSGWYTFNWEFYENALGDLEVAMNVYDASGDWLFTEILSNPGDDIDTVVGGNRYMWFTNIDVDGGIAVDDVSLSTVDTNPVERGNSNGILQASYATIAEAVADASDGNLIRLNDKDYSDKSPVSVTAEELVFSGSAGVTGVELELADGINQIFLDGQAAINVTGNGLDNVILANEGANTIDAGAGNDTIFGNDGDDAISGGEGTDTALYFTERANYTVAGETDESGRFTSFASVTDDNTDDDDEGTDTLDSIERLEFQDVALDLADPIQLLDADGNLIGTFDNLEAAVKAASSGDTLNIGEGPVALEASGSANGQVLIDKDLTIVGAGAGLTTLLAQANTGGGSSGTPGAAAILVADGATVDFSGLGIDGNGFKVHTGLMFKGSGSVDNVDFSNISYSKYVGIAVGIYGNGSDVDVTNSIFTDIARIGAHYKGEGVTGDFTGNTYTGKGAGDHLDYAVEAGAGAKIVVEGNTISGNIGVAASDGSTSGGVLVTTYYGDGTSATVTDNTFDGNTVAVAVGYDENDTSEVTFTGSNTIDGSDVGVAVTGNAVVDGVETISGDSTNVEWNGGPGNNAIEGAGLADDLSGGAGNDTITGHEGNDTIDGGTGIDTAVYTGNRADFTVDAVAGTVTDNNAGDGDEGADTISGIEQIDFADGSVLIAGSDGYPTIQDAVAAAQDGDTIIVLAGSYSGTVSIDKQLTILGANAGTTFNGSRGAESVLTGGFHFKPGSAGSVIDGFAVVAGAAILGSLTTAYVQAEDITILNSGFDRGQDASFDASRGVETATGSGSGLRVEGNAFAGFHTGVYVNPGAEGVTVTGNGFGLNMVGLSNDDPDDFTVSDNLFVGNKFEQIGLGVVDNIEDLSTQIADDNQFTNTGETPLVSIYPLSGDTQLITGTAFADTFNGDQTSTGADQLFEGLGGNDTINAGGGNDVLIGGTGADAMTGGTGDDLYEVDNAGDTVFEFANEGTDTVGVSLASYTLGANVENGFFTGTGAYSLSGNNLANELVGGDGGGTLSGENGRDTLIGGDGEDRLIGGGSVDTMDGGEGNDRYDVTARNDVINDTGASTGDMVISANSEINLNDFTGIENGTVTGSRNLNVTGNASDNVLRGNDGNNILTGQGGADVLMGGAGDDRFDFNSVSDSTASSTDKIRDFQVATVEGLNDVIDLFDIDAKSTALFNNAFTFIGTDAFSSKEGELRYYNTSNSTMVEGDVNGDGVADLVIRLIGNMSLSDADFVL